MYLEKQELQVTFRGIEVLSRTVYSKQEAQKIVDAFTQDAIFSGDLEFHWVELDEDTMEELQHEIIT